MINEYTDELTGLYNRKGMVNLAGDYTNGEISSVLFLDIDNFKTVNDLYGHSEGDSLLKSVAELIRSMADEIFPVRLGGDEFVVIIKGHKSREEINGMIDRLYEEIRNSRGKSIGFSVISLSIGITNDVLIRNDNLSTVIECSDVALYAAKNQGKSCYVYYGDIATDIKRREIIERKAEEAVRNDLFEIKYQPIVHMQTSEVVSVDLRILWKREEGNYWEIREYREIFEKNGYIKRFDIYMFEKACKCIRKIKEQINLSVRFNIILSRLSFLSPKIGFELKEIMNRYKVDFDDLELSVEEHAFGIRSEEELIKSINELSLMGFSISLTKFGYNFESIKYLPQLDIKSLRFDGYYIDNNFKDFKGGQIIRTLIRMGKELKLHVVGYGVSTKEKVSFLNGCGCDSMADIDEVGVLDGEGIVRFLKEHLTDKNREYNFRFRNDIQSEDKAYMGHVNGRIEFVDGVCNEYGGIKFLGGDRANNIVVLPVGVMASDSYTVSMWIKPDRPQGFVSAFYARYSGGFMSLMPYRSEVGISSFRIHEDVNVDEWHDATCRSVEPGKWSYLTISYNSFTGTMRYYINGRKAVTRSDVPTLFSCRDCMVGGDHFQESFEGIISGLSISNFAKSDDEIAQRFVSFTESDGFKGEDETFWMDDK